MPLGTNTSSLTEVYGYGTKSGLVHDSGFTTVGADGKPIKSKQDATKATGGLGSLTAVPSPPQPLTTTLHNELLEDNGRNAKSHR